jgi:hypothetical protein
MRKIKAVNRWGTTDNKPPWRIIAMGQSEHGAAVRSYLLHYFAAPFRSHHKQYTYAEPKPFPWAKPAHFDFSSSNFTLQDHILIAAGDALIKKEVR